MITTITLVPLLRLALMAALCMLLATKTVAQVQDYTETTAKESLSSMARSGGAWVTSNAEYWTADSGESAEFVMSYGLEADGYVLRGCMWGRSERVATPPFWTFYHAWDPVAGAILAYQIGPTGAAVVGHERPLTDGVTESIQTLAFPGTEPSRVRHVNRRAHADTLHTQSYNEVDGEWTPRRNYTWVWSSNVTEIPCARSTADAGH